MLKLVHQRRDRNNLVKRTTAVASVAVGAVAAGLLKTGAASVRAALGLPGDERGVLPVSAEC